jgi:hypothetical protein
VTRNLARLHLSEQQIPAFWSDIWSVPRKKFLKRAAIRQMHDIYRQANKVLVLDSTLAGHSVGARTVGSQSEPCHKIEVLAGVLASTWMRRHWIMQEAVLAREISVQFEEGPVDLTNLVNHSQRFAGQRTFQTTQMFTPGEVLLGNVTDAFK